MGEDQTAKRTRLELSDSFHRVKRTTVLYAAVLVALFVTKPTAAATDANVNVGTIVTNLVILKPHLQLLLCISLIYYY